MAKEKKEAKKPVTKKVELNDKEIYSFKANGNGKHLIKDKVYSVTGEIAKNLLKKGYGEIK